MRILIVGNVIKDVYLRFDENKNNFEIDDSGTPWVDIPFDGSYHEYFRRTSVFAGSAITLEVMQKLGLEASISGQTFEMAGRGLAASDSDETNSVSHIGDGRPCGTYRYILCDGDKIFYLVNSEDASSVFVAPGEPVDWIFIDRSAKVNEKLAADITDYLEKHTDTKLATFVYTKGRKTSTVANITSEASAISDTMRRLIDASALIFSDGSITEIRPTGVFCQITHDHITLDKYTRRYHVESDDMMTHLTLYSIISATILGLLSNGIGIKETVDMAALNAENSSISGTNDLTKLKGLYKMENEKRNDLRLIARTLVTEGKGILAADESGGSIHKKFEAAGIPDDEQHRRDYRNIFFTTPGLNKYVNGVILFDETARQKADDGRNFTEYLTGLGIVPGIKVDKGLVPFSDQKYASEKWTQGLDGLPERLTEYYQMGLRFAKWRAAFEVRVEDGKVITPTDHAINENARILAQYALDCQNAGIVPIVEPEVVHAGDYSIEVCKMLTARVLDALFAAMKEAGVDNQGAILKCNMVLAGSEYKEQSKPTEVGAATAEVLRRHVPQDLAGVVFLSGGQSVEQATENLQQVTNNGPFPWPVTFSYARALQGPALDAWKGDNANCDAAREAFAARLVANCNALHKN